MNESLMSDFKKRVRFVDVKIEVKDILKNLSVVSIVQFLFSNLITFIQVYLFTRNEISVWNDGKHNICLCLMIYCFAFLSLKFPYAITEYLNETAILKYCILFHEKNYYGMGDLFRKTVFLSIVLNCILYFPIILTLNFIMEQHMFGLRIIKPITTNIPGLIYDYHFYNFLTITFYSFNKPLLNLLTSLKLTKIVITSTIIKSIVNSSLCLYFMQDTHSFSAVISLNKIVIADTLSEFSSCLILAMYQYYYNPFPQTWIKLNLNLLDLKEFSLFFKQTLSGYKNFICYGIFNLWREFLIIIYSSVYMNKLDLESALYTKTVQLLSFIIFLSILFFSWTKFTKRKTIEDLYEMSIAYKSAINQNHNKYTNLLFKNYNSSYNYNSIKLIKTKILSNLLINIISYSIFFIFFFFDFIPLIFGTSINIITNIYLSMNCIINSLCVEIFTIGTLLNHKELFSHLMTGALLISLPTFILCLLFKVSAILYLIFCLNLGGYYCLYKFYKYVEQIDMRVVVLSQMNKT